jgi:acetyltransferase-like isoleucine patch superfamily enzyme
MTEPLVIAAKNRLLQAFARALPGGSTVRVWCHRWRGVEIGSNTSIGMDALIETAYPQLVKIGDGVVIGIRVTIIAHFREIGGTAARERRPTVQIEDDVYIGAGALILPNVRIGHGAVVSAGSVVTRSVAPQTMVQGNPARTVATCGVPLGRETPLKEFYQHLRAVDGRQL